MYFKTLIALPVLLITLNGCTVNKDQSLVINGTTTDPDIKSILLMKPKQDIRFDSVIEIPVTNGKFRYEAILEHPESVDLVLGSFRENGGGRYMPLFLENNSIDLTVHKEEDFDKNSVEGGQYNRAYFLYKDALNKSFGEPLERLEDSLNNIFEKEQNNIEALEILNSRLDTASSAEEKEFITKQINSVYKSQEQLANRFKTFSAERKTIYEEKRVFQKNYMEKNPNMVSYYFLLGELIYNKENTDVHWARKTLENLSAVYPDHPYNTLATNLINAMDNIRVGKRFLNFTAPDLEGNPVNLSEMIKGRIALLDLWATWCAPCIAKSRKMLPVYEEYKNKGFTIVGVAGEFKNTDRLKRFLEKEQWPWLNLVELDRENGIWQQYGVDGGGGGMFLIGANGEILAKDPSAEEVKALLESEI